MSDNLVEPNYLISYERPASFNDYRCVVNADGTQVIFERSLVDAGKATRGANLYILDLTPGSTPALFLQGSTLPLSSDRPDWSWQTSAVAFNWIEDGLQVGAALSDGTYPAPVTGTTGMEYPTWFPDGTTLAVMNSNATTSKPLPNTSTVTSGGTFTYALAGANYLGGMPSVNQINPNLIAFAGQTVQSPPVKYDQDKNYIWVMDTSQTPVSIVPLEDPTLSSGCFKHKFQARAPWWSPDGNWIVFESTRDTTDGKYAIYLYEVGKNNAAVQLTDPIFNMNHAKWFPNGFLGIDGDPTLIVAAYQPHWGATPQWPWGLATLDVSAFV